jgi:hypothetical protein
MKMHLSHNLKSFLIAAGGVKYQDGDSEDDLFFIKLIRKQSGLNANRPHWWPTTRGVYLCKLELQVSRLSPPTARLISPR